MSVVQTLIGNVKGPKGDTGATGATGASGAAATISVGTVSTTAYGNPAQVTNSGTSSAAVFDFVIPQGQPGEEVTDMAGLILGTMTTQTGEFPTPAVNDTGATLWGKVVKYFSDLRTLIGTKLAQANVVNNFTTTESGYALDARAGKTLNDMFGNRLGDVSLKRLAVSGSTTTDTLTATGNNQRHIVFTADSSAARSGAYFIWTNSSGDVYYKEITNATGMTIATSGGAISFTHTSGSVQYLDITLSASASTFLVLS